MTNKVKIPRTPTSPAPAPAPAPVSEEPMVAIKRVVLSKTIWVNVLAFVAFWIQKQYGFVISEELQMQALTLINIALRFVTHEKIAWGGSGDVNGTNQETS